MATSVESALQFLVAIAHSDESIGDAYLVGGCVRDALLGKPLRDIDVCAKDASAFARRAAQAAGSRVVELGDAGHPLYRVPLEGGQLDITPRRGSIDNDLALRDFTINAMAIPLARLPPHWPATSVAMLDPHGGLVDLKAGIIRGVSDRVFTEDPVRALRAARLSAVLDFSLDESTTEALPSALPGLSAVAPERVSTELLRLFDADRSVNGMRIMEAAGLLEFCFPELAEGYGIEQRPSHVYTVYRHQLAAFDRVDLLVAPARPHDDERRLWSTLWPATGWPDTRWGRVRDLINQHRAAIRLATLLHDVGKPRTRTLDPDGRTRFLGHAGAGAALAVDRLRAWRFSSAIVDRIALLIEQHLRPGQVASPGTPPTDRALYRFHRALGDATPDVCFLFLADSLATSPDVVEARWPAYVAHVRDIITWIPQGPAGEPHGIIDGREVMAATGLPPGPQIGRILAEIEEAVAAGELRTVEDALDCARRLASSAREAGTDDGGAP